MAPRGDIDERAAHRLDERDGERTGLVHPCADDARCDAKIAFEVLDRLQKQRARCHHIKRRHLKTGNDCRGQQRLSTARANVDEPRAPKHRLAHNLGLIVPQAGAAELPTRFVGHWCDRAPVTQRESDALLAEHSLELREGAHQEGLRCWVVDQCWISFAGYRARASDSGKMRVQRPIQGARRSGTGDPAGDIPQMNGHDCVGGGHP